MKMAQLHSELQADILRYLSIHPQASDTLGGVHSHWLDNERFSPNIEAVETALNRLIDHGELQRLADSSGAALFTMANKKH